MWEAPRPAAIVYARLKRIPVTKAERVLPGDAVTLEDGLRRYLEEVGESTQSIDLGGAPEAVRAAAERLVAAARGAGLLVDRVLVDGELVHVRLVSLCGSAVLTVAPDGSVEVTRSEGLEVRFEEDRLVHRCIGGVKVDRRYAELA